MRLGAFGDIVHTLPLAADLVAAGHTVGWLCEDRWACVLDGSAAVERIHRLPRDAFKGRSLAPGERLLVLRRLMREVRAAAYDTVIDAQGLAKSALLVALTSVVRRVGHAQPRARELSWIVSRRRSPTSAVHVIDQQRALGLRLCGEHHPRGGWRFPLPAWTTERTWASYWLFKAGLQQPWMLNVGAGWPTKVWPKRRQIEFAQALKVRRKPLLLLWGNHNEHDLAEEIISESGHGVLAPPTSIPQLAGVIAQGSILISGDTGPLHLGLALGIPAIGLFGPVPAERNGPRGRGYRTFQAPGAAWERKDVSRVDMGAITAVSVIDAALQVIAEHPTAVTSLSWALRCNRICGLRRPGCHVCCCWAA